MKQFNISKHKIDQATLMNNLTKIKIYILQFENMDK